MGSRFSSRGKGKSVAAILAAPDSSQTSKSQADYVCKGDNDQIQLQEAIDSLPNRGGTIKLLAGSYVIDGKIDIYDTVNLYGEQSGIYGLNGVTRIDFADGSVGDMIHIHDGAYNAFVEDILLDGNKSNCPGGNDCIHLGNNVRHPAIRRTGVFNAARDGIHIENSDYYMGAYMDYIHAEYNRRHGFYLSGKHGYYEYLLALQRQVEPGDTGIQIENAERNVFIGAHSSQCNANHNWAINDSDANFFVGCGANNGYVSAFSMHDSNRNVFDACWVYNPSRGNNGVYSSFCLYDSVYNVVKNSQFWCESGNSYGSAIKEYGTADENIFKDNVITYNAAPGIVTVGSDTKVSGNIGYRTENSGTAELAAGSTSTSVNHGLDTTPSNGGIVVTPITAWGNMTQFYVDTITSSSFVIRADQAPGQIVHFACKISVK